ncbi:MAG: hypothetical protein HN849_20815 [Victivallales bacterium]|jgi:hypothetical protein|nr:hypothetical protein [Victivallales bacterium]MBT7301981.1 hypothetical protein [Victivallales bacterium]
MEAFDREQLAEWAQSQGVPMPDLAGRTVTVRWEVEVDDWGEAFESLSPLRSVRRTFSVYLDKWGDWMASKGHPELTEDELERMARPFIRAEIAVIHAEERAMDMELDPLALTRELRREENAPAAVMATAGTAPATEGKPVKAVPLLSEVTEAKLKDARKKDRNRTCVGDLANAGKFFVA